MRRLQDYSTTGELALQIGASGLASIDFRPMVGLEVLGDPCWRFLVRGVSVVAIDVPTSDGKTEAEVRADGEVIGTWWATGNGFCTQQSKPFELPLPLAWSGVLDVFLINRFGVIINHGISALVRREPRKEAAWRSVAASPSP